MRLGTGRRMEILDSFFMEIREDRDRGRGRCDFSVATRVEQSGTGWWGLGSSEYCCTL